MARFSTGDERINRAGAPTQQKQVEAWFLANPGGSVSKCAKELGVSRPTARKWMPKSMKMERLQAEQNRLQAKQSPKPSKLKRIWEIIKE
jgi:transposase-like protein